MLERREHQVAEMPQRVGAYRVFLVVPDQPAQLGLLLVHAEMIQPEPDHLLLKLRPGVHRAQQVAPGRFVGEAVAMLVERLARLFPGRIIGQCIDALAFAVDRGDGLHRIDVRDLHALDLRGNRHRQRRVPGAQLRIQEPRAAEPPIGFHAVAVDPETRALEPQDVAAGQRVRRGRGLTRRPGWLARTPGEQRCGNGRSGKKRDGMMN
jgi:hypothetical protein